MKEYQSLRRTRWDCNYYVVIMPKRRKKSIYGALREVFWGYGYFVLTAGLGEERVRAYIRNQEQEDDRYDQMKLVL